MQNKLDWKPNMPLTFWYNGNWQVFLLVISQQRERDFFLLM